MLKRFRTIAILTLILSLCSSSSAFAAATTKISQPAETQTEEQAVPEEVVQEEAVTPAEPEEPAVQEAQEEPVPEEVVVPEETAEPAEEQLPEAEAATIVTGETQVTVSTETGIANYSQGHDVTLTGSVSSNVMIRRIELGVVSATTKDWVKGCKYDNTALGRYSFELSEAQPQIAFTTLPKGSYYFRIWVHLTNGEVKQALNKEFTVTAATANFSLTDAVELTDFSAGHAPAVSGLITSDVKIKRVEIGIVSDKTKGWVSGHKFDKSGIGAKEFDISTASASLHPETLATGKYYYRIWVHAENGVTKKVTDKAFTVTAATAEFSLDSSGIAKEYVQAGTPAITGTIISDVKIKRVEIGIVDPATKNWISTCKYDNSAVNAMSFDLAKSTASIKYSTLAPGTYYFRIWVHAINGQRQMLLTQEITVKPPAQISGHNVPSEMYDGKDIDLTGTITSAYPINRVEAGVVSAATKDWVSGCKFDQTGIGSKTFKLSAADSSTDFASLKAGSYYYRIWIKTENGLVQKVIDEPFTVRNLFTLTGCNTPPNVKYGAQFNAAGTITTAYPNIRINRIEVGIVSDSTKDWVEGFKYDDSGLDVTSFDLSTAATSIPELEVEVGKYYYRIWVHTDNGEIRKVMDHPFTVSSNVISVARKEVGATTGKKYWEWYYGTKFKNTDSTPWCGAFVAWVYNQAGEIARIIKVEDYGNLGYVPSYSKFATKFSKWVPVATAKPGDLIIFGSGNGTHIGIVEKNDGTTITTIEGNTGASANNGGAGECLRKTYPVTSSRIKGIVRP